MSTAPEPIVLPPMAAQTVRRSRGWKWWLGAFALTLFSCCGGCGIILFWFSSKPIDLSDPIVERHGPFVQISLAYNIKARNGGINPTELVVEGAGWKHRQPAFGGITIPYFGRIIAQIPPQGNRPREAGSVTIHLESQSPRGDMDRSSNYVYAVIPAQ
jgi:hypothetical protein